MNNVYIGMSISWILLRNYTAVRAKTHADAPASRIDKKKSSPETCNFFLPNRFHLTLILEPQRRNACPIVLLPRNSCMNIICFFNFRLEILIGSFIDKKNSRYIYTLFRVILFWIQDLLAGVCKNFNENYTVCAPS